MSSTALDVLYAACDEAVCDATDHEACPECEDTGEVVDEHTRYGARLVPCPLWCATAHRLYDDRGDHDRRQD